jgi:hypothetical protein
MALTHNVCGSNVKAFCLKLADGTDDNWVALSCPVCYTTVSMGECTGVLDATPEIYGQTFIPYGDANKFFRSNGPGAAPTWEVGPVGAKGDKGDKGDQGIQGIQGVPGTGFLYQSIKQNSIVTNVTTLQTLVSFDAFSAGLMNVLGRRLVIKGKGFFTTAGGETPTIRFDVYMAAASRISLTSAAVTAGLTSSPFEYEFVFQTSVIGANGKLIPTASMLISLDGTAYTPYMSIPDTDTAAFDLTGVFGPAVTVTCGGTALTSIDVRSSYAQVS